MPRSALPSFVLGSAIVAAAAILSRAGPLTPPGGTVASTYKTLSEVEPRTAISAATTPGDALSMFKITQPGSYYLTGNLTGVSGKSGIWIAASNVSLDLCGFTMQGVAGSLQGIASGDSLINLVVRNGIVSGWGSAGIRLTGNIGSDRTSLVENIIVSDNAQGGILVNGPSVVRGCIARSNIGGAIATGNGAIIESCSAADNTGLGFSAGYGSVLRACAATGNTGNGFLLFNATIACCEAIENGGHGIQVQGRCVVSGNRCDSNVATGTAGIQVFGVDNRIEGNTCSNNAAGIVLDPSAAGNRLDSNSLTNNQTFGFSIPGANNIIIRNTAHSNPGGNYAIAAGNAVAPLVAVTGSNNWPAIANSAHAFANFGY